MKEAGEINVAKELLNLQYEMLLTKLDPYTRIFVYEVPIKCASGVTALTTGVTAFLNNITSCEYCHRLLVTLKRESANKTGTRQIKDWVDKNKGATRLFPNMHRIFVEYLKYSPVTSMFIPSIS
jgi:hypothetical protein